MLNKMFIKTAESRTRCIGDAQTGHSRLLEEIQCKAKVKGWCMPSVCVSDREFVE